MYLIISILVLGGMMLFFGYQFHFKPNNEKTMVKDLDLIEDEKTPETVELEVPEKQDEPLPRLDYPRHKNAQELAAIENKIALWHKRNKIAKKSRRMNRKVNS